MFEDVEPAAVLARREVYPEDEAKEKEGEHVFQHLGGRAQLGRGGP